MSRIFLGYPPLSIRQFIEEHYGPQINTTPLTFTAEQAGSTVKMTANSSAPSVSLQTSTDGKNWTDFKVGETEITLANVGDKVYFRAGEAGNTQMAARITNYNYFVMTGKIAASGNIMSLLDASCQLTSLENRNYAFCQLFKNCKSLTQAPELPATTLATYCYYYIFQNCSALTKAPELPATTLANSCYANMFSNCSALTKAPELPATTLAYSCYNTMFEGCTSLTQAPKILPATTLADSCYNQMFFGCTSLTQAPELPATTLATECYVYMFYRCSALETASFPNLGKETVASDVVENQYTFEEAALSIEATCKDGILVINSTAV